jgi:hypothetical protein
MIGIFEKARASQRTSLPSMSGSPRSSTAKSGTRGGAGCTILLQAEDTHGFGHLSKNDFMLSGSTASVWPDEAGGCHDPDRLPVRSRLALRAQRQWRRQSQPW